MALSTSPMSFFKTSDVRLWVLKVIRLIKTSFKRSRKCRFFRCTGCRITFHMAFQHLDTTLHLLKQSRLLRWPEGRLWVLRATHLLKSYLNDSVKVSFLMPRIQNMISRVPLTPGNIASSTSPKSFFKTSRRQIMSSQGSSKWPASSHLAY
jgi:hypothetical protein